MKGSKCSYCGKKLVEAIFAPYCSRACVRAVTTKRGSNPDGSTSAADVARLVKKARQKSSPDND